MQKYLIVNGDDFGLSHGVNRGILRAHAHGIVTSASLMVNMPASEEACALASGAPELSLGLHADLGSVVDLGGVTDWRSALHRQLERFRSLVGRPPTHLDSHHDLHRDPRLLPVFEELARQLDVPLRAGGPIRVVTAFYGQWGGASHPEQVGVDTLIHLLATQVEPGLNELCCHPGYVDTTLRSSYRLEREIELQTLCHPAVGEAIVGHGIELISFRDVKTTLAGGVS